MAVEARGGKQPSTETVAAALDNLLNSTGSKSEFDTLLVAMESQPALSCGLLRLLTTAVSASSSSTLLPGPWRSLKFYF